MTFASPLAFWWLAITIPIFAIFFFRVRPAETVVPTLALWERFLRSNEYHGFGMRFGRWPTLLFQLLIVVVLILALSNPRTSDARPVVVVLDDSATMQTRDAESRSRFEEAKAAAIERIQAAPAGVVSAIVLAGQPVRILAGRGDTPRTQAAKVAALTPRDVNADFPRALRLASVLARETGASSIVAISDKPAATSTDTPLTWRPVGKPTPNFGIAGLRRSNDGRAIVVTLHQSGLADQPASIHLDADGVQFDRKEVRLNAPTLEIVLQPPPSNHARFEIHCEPSDALPLDNVAYGVWTEIPTARVALLTNGDLSLVAALSQPGIELTTILPAQWPTTRPADIVVLDTVKAELPGLDSARLLTFAGRDVLNLAATSTPAADQRPIRWVPSHPLLRDVDLLTWKIQRTATFGPGTGTRSIVSGQDAALVLEARASGDSVAPVREILVNFELKDSNLASRAGFPIFVWNAVQYLMNRSEDEFTLAYATGSPVRAAMQCDAERAGFQKVAADDSARTIALNWFADSSTPVPEPYDSIAASTATTDSLWTRLLIAAAALMLIELELFSLNILRLG